MLHHIEIENFYSIRDRQVIDLTVSDKVVNNPERYAPAWVGARERAPKVVAVFGSNASGKSTILKALSFLQWFVRDSFGTQPDTPLPFHRFENREWRGNPTRLRVQLGGVENPADSGSLPCPYAYELVLGGEGQSPVLREALYYWPASAARRVTLFTRDDKGTVTAARKFAIGGGYKKVLERVLRPNASVISTLAQLKHPFATALWEASASVLSNIFIERGETAEQAMVQFYAAHPDLVQRLNEEIERIDLGITGLQIFRVDSTGEPLAFFTHQGLDRPLPLIYESHGTRQFFKIFPVLLHALETGGIAIIDELDSSMHPHVLAEVVGWFYSPQKNTRNAQLWMTCHALSLLEELSKEEVLLTEKSSDGATSVFSLKDVQGLRRSDNYYKKYVGGQLGALPKIG